MKVEKGVIEVAGLPHDELKVVIGIMSEAEKQEDVTTLKWSARRIAMLYEVAEIIDAEYSDTAAGNFNFAWGILERFDPIPAIRYDRPNISRSVP
jgi:hypothetical protein